MNRERIIVIGAGAGGMLAAGRAAAAGAEVLLLEKMRSPGRKVRITGKGRCNLTNIAPLPEFIEHFGRNGRFLRQSFHRFFAPELMEFFRSLGVELVIERGGRVFPASGRAPDVVAALRHWLGRQGVELRTSAPVDDIIVEAGRVRGVVCRGRRIGARAVVLTTGGASYPATGSTGDGYRMAGAAGHRIVPVRPALVPLVTAGESAFRMAGLRLRNTGVRLVVDSRQRARLFGELEFTDQGVAGPTILTLSGMAVDALRGRRQVELVLDLKPALDERRLDARLQRDFARRGKEPLASVLRGLLPRELVAVCLELTSLPPGLAAGQVRAGQRRRLRTWLKDFRLRVTGHRPLAEAIVTAGGIDLREVDPRTMQSRLVAGLFLAGEILDLQGDTGGYNLQSAFSTGWLAGGAAAALSREA